MIRTVSLVLAMVVAAPQAFAADAVAPQGYELEIALPDSFTVDTRPMIGEDEEIEPAIVTDDERHKDIILAWV